MEKNTSAVGYIGKQTEWQRELMFLRDMLLETELKETIKWGIPVYTINGKNVVGIGAFKSYFGLWFYQGAFLKDTHHLLMGHEGTKGLRQLRFSSMEEINPDIVRAYVQEAIENQKAGKEIKPEKKKLEMPELLQNALDENAELDKAFAVLTPGKQREYAAYINGAKREETRRSRLQKITPMILKKVGLHDKYK